MRTDIVLTLTGPDRVGIVEEVTRVLLEADGNVETSRMAHLGGEFAILMLVSLPAEKAAAIADDFRHLTADGYVVTSRPTEQPYAQTHPGWTPYRIEVRGADHEGIIHEIAHGLSQQGINIESMETGLCPAPISGALLFTMKAVVAVPPELAEQTWISDLDEACRLANVDVTVSVVEAGWDGAC
jgi:glycine cleavage system transcriptional repressor